MFGEVFRNLFGWNVTRPSALDPQLYDQLYRLYVSDEEQLGVREFFQQKNPAAYQSMTTTMLEGVRKGYWQPTDWQLRQIRQLNADASRNAGTPKATVLERQGSPDLVPTPDAADKGRGVLIATVAAILLLLVFVVFWLRRRR